MSTMLELNDMQIAAIYLAVNALMDTLKEDPKDMDNSLYARLQEVQKIVETVNDEKSDMPSFYGTAKR